MIRFVLSIFRHTSGCLVFIVISIVGLALSHIAPFLNGKLIDFPHVDLVDRPPCVAAPEAPPRRPPAPGFPSITKR